MLCFSFALDENEVFKEMLIGDISYYIWNWSLEINFLIENFNFLERYSEVRLQDT